MMLCQEKVFCLLPYVACMDILYTCLFVFCNFIYYNCQVYVFLAGKRNMMSILAQVLNVYRSAVCFVLELHVNHGWNHMFP